MSSFVSIVELFAFQIIRYVTVKTVVSIDRIRMLRTDGSGETRLALHVPSSLSWKVFYLLLLLTLHVLCQML